MTQFKKEYGFHENQFDLDFESQNPIVDFHSSQKHEEVPILQIFHDMLAHDRVADLLPTKPLIDPKKFL